jgi:hypothetical protein
LCTLDNCKYIQGAITALLSGVHTCIALQYKTLDYLSNGFRTLSREKKDETDTLQSWRAVCTINGFFRQGETERHMFVELLRIST